MENLVVLLRGALDNNLRSHAYIDGAVEVIS